MNTILSLALLGAFVFLVARAVLRTREVAAKISGEPDPVRLAVFKQAAIAEALVALDSSGFPPEVKAERRASLLAKQQALGVPNRAHQDGSDVGDGAFAGT